MSFREQLQAQPARLRALIGELRRADHPLRSAACARLLEKPRLLLTGMGSSLISCYPAYLRLAREGVRVMLWETAEVLHFAGGTIDSDTLVVAVSQSGETAEIVALLERLPPGQPLLGVTNVAGSTLGRRATVALELGAERSRYASSQTYVNSLALLLAVAHAAQGATWDAFLAAAEQAADALDGALAESFSRSDVEIDRQAHLVFLARGPSLAAAQQAALMFHEVAVRGAAAMSAAAFRHGPLEMAGPSLQAVILLPYGPTATLVENLGAELERFGARVLRVADARLDAGDFRHPPVEEELAPVVNIAPLQAMAHRCALALGRDPGAFLQGESVTRTE